MTNTEQEREAFEAVASDNGKWPKAIERDAKGNYLLLTTANGWMWWQAARLAHVGAVPKGWSLREAAQDALDWLDDDDINLTHNIRERLRSALAASPNPPES